MVQAERDVLGHSVTQHLILATVADSALLNQVSQKQPDHRNLSLSLSEGSALRILVTGGAGYIGTMPAKHSRGRTAFQS